MEVSTFAEENQTAAPHEWDASLPFVVCRDISQMLVVFLLIFLSLLDTLTEAVVAEYLQSYAARQVDNNLSNSNIFKLLDSPHGDEEKKSDCQ